MDGRRIAKEDEYDALCALIGPGDKISPKQTEFEVEHRVVINYEKLRRMVANKRSGKDMRPARGRRRELSGTSCDFITGLVRPLCCSYVNPPLVPNPFVFFFLSAWALSVASQQKIFCVSFRECTVRRKMGDLALSLHRQRCDLGACFGRYSLIITCTTAGVRRCCAAASLRPSSN